MGSYALIPELSLWGLLPMVAYIIVAFLPKCNGLTAAFVACAVGFVLTGQTPAMFGSLITTSLGSTLGLIGLIVMLGAGLGKLMTESGVSRTMVGWIINGIGVKTEKRAILCVMLSTILVCGLLGTLAGGCAIIAPILIPVVAAAKLKPATVGALFQCSGETGLIWGPFTGPTIALLAITGLSYGQMMLWAALPFGIIWAVVIFFVALHIQRNPKYDEVYQVEGESTDLTSTPQEVRTTIAFILTFLGLVAYSLITEQGTAYTVFVVIVLMLVITLFSGKNLSYSFKMLSQGMGTMAGTFFLFILLNVMLVYVGYGGGFDALGALFLNAVGDGGRGLIVIFGTLVGSFGVSGGAVAQLQVTHDLFSAALETASVPMEVWALALICGSRVTSSIYPGTNMIAPMGLARSESLKAMLVGGWAVSMVSIAFIIVWALVGMPIFFPV